MVNSDQVQKTLNDLLDGKEGGVEDDIFLVEDTKATDELIPQPQKDESIIQPQKIETESTSLDEKNVVDLPVEPVAEENKIEATEQDEVQEKPVRFLEPEKVENINEEKIEIKKEELMEEKTDEINKAKDFVHESFGFLDKSQGELNQKIKSMESGRKEDEIKMKAMSAGLGYINLKGLPIMPEVLKLIDEAEAKEAGLICFLYKKGEEIRLATSEVTPMVRDLVNKVKTEHPAVRISLYLTSKESMDAVLKLYSSLPRWVERVDDVQVLEKEIDSSSLEIKDIREIQEKVGTASTTEILGILIMAATRIEASDIHIEAEEKEIKVRFRVDGVLHDVAMIQKEAWNNLVSRIKLNAGLKINIQDRPQDGSFTLSVQGKPIDFRVSILPTNYGESVVIRILFHDKIRKMSLDNLGIDDYNRNILEKEILKPNGLLVITGPTGSGKTTTLYAILNKLNTSSNKIITVEDPIEYKLDGVNQSEIKEEKGYTFAKALRSIVRQDPDVLLVGEIRDQETVEIVLNAALTGHLVLSTIHANSAAGVIPRFMALGSKPYLLSPAVNVSIAQRLVRRVCEFCKQPIILKEEERARVMTEMESLSFEQKKLLGITDLNNVTFYQGQGCKECSGLGYKGQIGIFEILQVTDKIKQMIFSGEVSEQQLKQVALENGMITLAQDGIIKAIKGGTSLEEVFRVI